MSDHTFRSVERTRPVAPYVGGKKQLAAAVIERIDAIPHTTYAEVFVGMGGVFFRRTRAPRAEVVNDLSSDVATLFRVLQRHYVPLMDELRWRLTSRREFERLAASDPATLTDLERAARFLYLQRTTFGGKVAARSFGVSPTNSGRFDIAKLGPILEAAHERLSGVIIEALPYADFLARYDRPGTLFYLDPPYWGSEGDYGRDMFGREDFERLAKALASLQGRFVMSINDTPEVRKVFKRFALAEVDVTYTISRGEGVRRGELIVTG
ncbi:MAG: DNA adenine methylase [Rhodoblastus sp.]